MPLPFLSNGIGNLSVTIFLRSAMDVTTKLFFDTNILLDVVLRREQFVHDSASVWAMCETGATKGFVSAISLNNVHYVAAKFIGRDNAMSAVRLILDIFSVVPLDLDILREAANVPHIDFEDDIQLASALRCGADYLISRNTGDYPAGLIPVLTPTDYLAFARAGRNAD